MTDKTDILERVVGRNKERDLRILRRLANGETEKEVGDSISLRQNRISQIATANAELLNELTLRSELATSAGRLRKAYRIVSSKLTSQKDPLDWLEYIRRETAEASSKQQNGPRVYNIIYGHRFAGERNNIPVRKESPGEGTSAPPGKSMSSKITGAQKEDTEISD